MAEYSFLSGDPVRGGSLFAGLGCNACHSLFGIGADVASDLAKAPPSSWSPVRAVADMWSHGPEMWEKMKDAQLGFPHISEQDMVDLLAYLYLIRYLDQPGDPTKGGVLFATKHCADCHTLSGTGKGIGPNLSHLNEDTPIMWAQLMWNHGQSMEALIAQERIEWPLFQGSEMTDLLAYLQSSTSGKRKESELFPADPIRGKVLFKERGCHSCHSINADGGKTGPELGASQRSAPSITQFAGLMWNHSPQMYATMKEHDIPRPKFAGREMADLISYLYVVRYMEPPGESESGKTVFRDKHCAECHGADGHGGSSGPNLARRPDGYHAPQMAYTVWTHGPQMYRKMQEKSIPWPTLTERELRDLMTFLSSL
ncbi:MAG: c-type cytochrome [Acidobacteria bacterium]|nr:c-type cytochrome [Acidobacteriota bacterium]